MTKRFEQNTLPTDEQMTSVQRKKGGTKSQDKKCTRRGRGSTRVEPNLLTSTFFSWWYDHTGTFLGERGGVSARVKKQSGREKK